MTDLDNLTPGEVLAEASVAEFISELGLGIARAQQALDSNTVDQLAEYIVPIPALDGRSLLELGLSPAFYHYQHADISLSMQLSLRIEKDLGVKLNLSGSVKDTTTENEDQSSSESSESSGSSDRKTTRDAKVSIQAASVGSLTVGGTTHNLAGDSPRERIAALKAAIEADNPDVIPWVTDEPPRTVTLEPKNVHADDQDQVVIRENTVAYVFDGRSAALVKVENDDATDYVLNSAHTASIAAGTGSAVAHADALVNEITANHEGYEAIRLSSSTGVFGRTSFDTSEHDYFNDLKSYELIRSIAEHAEGLGLSLSVEGFADRQRFAENNTENNVILGNARRDFTIAMLRRNNFTGAVAKTESRGDRAAAENGDTPGQKNQDFRKAEVKITDAGVRVLIERTDDSKPAIDDTPSPSGAGGNRFLGTFGKEETHQFKQQSEVEIQGGGTSFGLAARDAGTNNLTPADAPTHAQQLAARINASGGDHTASHSGNFVTVYAKDDKFSLMLVSISTSKIDLSGSDAIVVTQQFKRSSSSSVTAKRTGNKAVAVAGSVDVGYSRKFEVDVKGNSSISARLVSLPAPPEFLSVIKDYLGD